MVCRIEDTSYSSQPFMNTMNTTRGSVGTLNSSGLKSFMTTSSSNSSSPERMYVSRTEARTRTFSPNTNTSTFLTSTPKPPPPKREFFSNSFTSSEVVNGGTPNGSLEHRMLRTVQQSSMTSSRSYTVHDS